MTEALRMFIIGSGFTAVLMIIALNHAVRRTLSFGHVMTRLGTCAVVLSLAYGAAEAQAQGVPGAPRLWWVAGGLVWLNVGCLATLRERRQDKRKDKR